VLEPSFWLSVGFKGMLVSGLTGLLVLAVYPQWFCYFQLCSRFSLQSHIFGLCFAFPRSFLIKCLVFRFYSLSLKFRQCPLQIILFELV